MESVRQDALLFFGRHPAAFPLCEALTEKLLSAFPQTVIRVRKTQMTFSGRHVYACVSLLRVRKKAELPDPYIVVTLGLPYPLDSDRVAAKSEPYPGRWTTHIVIGAPEEIDDELMTWAEQAYSFAQSK